MNASGFFRRLPVLLAGGIAWPCAALPPVTLEPFPDSGVDVETVRNYYGRCGPATVQVLGVAQEEDGFFKGSIGGGSAVVVIGDGGAPVLEIREQLSDHNGVACVTGTAGPRLLIWSNCGGSACGDDFAFTVVDPAVAAIVSDEDCDAACAASLSGSSLPFEVNGAE
ncbi:MAG TPA: hypothetical protein PKD48_02570 [Sphingopyxis sp.]|nr:hypothetical protein [Sphingopyxis sp.]HMQ19619.1 hypothetical protein [Sphingopyxis sp.]